MSNNRSKLSLQFDSTSIPQPCFICMYKIPEAHAASDWFGHKNKSPGPAIRYSFCLSAFVLFSVRPASWTKLVSLSLSLFPSLCPIIIILLPPPYVLGDKNNKNKSICHGPPESELPFGEKGGVVCEVVGGGGGSAVLAILSKLVEGQSVWLRVWLAAL